MRKITLKWLKQAEADLAAARDSLQSGLVFRLSRVEKKP
jgi:HEPN domain-containing protein